MGSKRYANFLTMVLVILIVAIFGIGGYFVYSTVTETNTNNKSQESIQEFESTRKIIKKTTNTVDNEVATDETANDVSENSQSLADILASAENSRNEVDSETTSEEVEKTYVAGYEMKGIIEIPKTGIKYPVLESVTKTSLENGIGIAYPQGSDLNVVGNVCLYGHNYRNKLFFSKNKNLAKGDKIYITDQKGEKVTYVIYNIYTTTPDDASYMIRDTAGRREISLQTCTDDSSGRIIIWAAEEGSITE